MDWSAIGSVAGSVIGGLFGNSESKRQVKLQREFAQNGIQWKVADAQKAGVHPLFALGAPTIQYTPIQTGIGSDIANAGQQIGRAIDSYKSQGERLEGFTKASQALTLEKMKLENDLLKNQISSANATLNQAGNPPPVPTETDRYLIPGQGSSLRSKAGDKYNLVQTSPMQRQSSSRDNPNQEAGAVAETGYMRTPTGYAPVISKDAMDRMEEDFFGKMGWNIRNRLLPMFKGGSEGRTPFKPPKGYYWHWNAVLQEYQLVKYADPKPVVIPLR